MENELFMGPLGTGSWHEWTRLHLVGLLGSVWYNLSRSDASNTTWSQLTLLIKLKPLLLGLPSFSYSRRCRCRLLRFLNVNLSNDFSNPGSIIIQLWLGRFGDAATTALTRRFVPVAS